MSIELSTISNPCRPPSQMDYCRRVKCVDGRGVAAKAARNDGCICNDLATSHLQLGRNSGGIPLRSLEAGGQRRDRLLRLQLRFQDLLPPSLRLALLSFQARLHNGSA